MYCHKCGTRMPEDSSFCRKCGARLIAGAEMSVQEPTPTDSERLETQERGRTRKSNAKHGYYQGLAKVLAENGFRMDVRLMEKGELFESIPDWAIKVGQVGVAAELGPIAAALTAPFQKAVSTLYAIGGEELYNELADIASLFKIIAARYHLTKPVIFAVTEADKLDISQAEARASALCTAMANLFRPQKSWQRWLKNILRGQLGAVCLYVFFDEQRGAQMASSILKKCQKKERRLIPSLEYQVDVLPIVANVPAKQLVHKKGLWSFFFQQGWGVPVSREMLTRAFL